MSNNNPVLRSQWAALSQCAGKAKKRPIQDLFNNNTNRFDDFSFGLKNDLLDVLVDFSKQNIDQDTLDVLVDLAREMQVVQKRDQMFKGDILNPTEGRAVLHTALRRPYGDEVCVSGENVIPEIHDVFDRIKAVTDQIRSGQYRGATGMPIRHVVSLGVGGSDLGPRFVCHALDNAQQTPSELKVHFVSNIDPVDIHRVLASCKPEETAFIVTSKSFTTQETLTNALAAREWLQDNLPEGQDTSPHFLAVSSNVEAAQNFGIATDNIFPMWEWVNGRFSLWSAVGMPIALQHGFDNFKKLLAGAYEMDQHFKEADLANNIPVLMALVGVWNSNFMEASAHAVLPYAQQLQDLPRYLQQLEMESNGKSVDLDGNPITDYSTCPVLFGEAGTIGQHSFYQLLHQGTDMVSCDFIGVVQGRDTTQNHHKLLLSNMLAQGQALMQGQEQPSAEEPHRHFSGNKPSTTILLDKLDPYHLGMLIALYEHKCFVQGVIWNINSFDQFGVELGKAMSRKIENNDVSKADPSTQKLFSLICE